MTDQATFGIAIVANDKTARGRKSAEKGFGDTAKRASKFGRKQAQEDERYFSRSSRAMGRTFAETERAASKLFGGRSLTGGLASKLGGLRSITSAVGSGFGEAAASGGALEVTIGAVGAAAAGTVAVLGAAAYAAFSLSDKWAKSAATIGRTAEIMGVGTKAMQEFALAAERVGVDRGAATGALGGLSQTLNDARYGRNAEAVALLARMGVQMKTKADGTVDVEGMLPQLADALTRQNSSGRRTAARILGINEAALPVFTQGGKSLSSEMADTDQRGAVLTDQDVALGKKLQRRDTIGAQMVEQATNAAQRTLAQGVNWAGDKVLGGARSFSESVHNDFVPSARLNERAADKMDRAATRFEQSSRAGVYAGAGASVAAIRRAAAETGVDPNMLLGIAAHESSLNPSAKASTSSATGLFQFLSGTWLGMIKNHGAQHGLGWAADQIVATRNGYSVRSPAMKARILALRTDPYLNALMGGEMARENAAALAPILGHTPSTGESYMANFLGIGGAKKFFRAERANPNASAASIFPTEAAANRGVFYARGGRARSLEEVLDLMTSFVDRPIKVEVQVSAPQGSKVKTRAGHGNQPAVSHALETSYIPVHGG